MKVGVIGAGPSGLTTIKQLRDEGHDVVCIERNADIGGIWYRHNADEDEMKVFDDMYLTISMKLMAFSDYMVNDRVFADRTGYLHYLKAYADQFGLREHVAFNTSVTAVEKIDDRWQVTATTNGEHVNYSFDALAVCTGPFQSPNTGITDIGRFTGDVIHSSRYRNNRAFHGKHVLVIGLAESGADIVRQISDVAARTTLAIRSHSFLVPRLSNGGYATDSYTVRAHHYEMYVRASQYAPRLRTFYADDTMTRERFIDAVRHHGLKATMKEVATQIDLDALAARLALTDPASAISTAVAEAIVTGSPSEAESCRPTDNMGQPLYPPKLDLFTESTSEVVDYINEWNRKSHNGQGSYAQRIIFCKNVSFVPNILNGKITVDDSGIKTIDGKTVHFNNGAMHDYDTIVLCTGFDHDFSLLRGLEIPGNNVRNLYKHAFHADHDGRLALIGFVRPFSGGIPICAEMQARYFALLCSGTHKLPPDIHTLIQHDKEWEEHWTSLSPRHHEAIHSQIFFLDSIAKEIDCLPTCQQLVDDPELLIKMWFYSFNQSSYRLTGPHSMHAAARESILGEDLPGGKLVSMVYLIANTLLPHHIHPKDLTLTTAGWADL